MPLGSPGSRAVPDPVAVPRTRVEGSGVSSILSLLEEEAAAKALGSSGSLFPRVQT